MPEEVRREVGFIQFTGRLSYGDPRFRSVSSELDDLLGIPSVCRGCRHYEGGLHDFVCAMHPMGVEAETCPDFESEN